MEQYRLRNRYSVQSLSLRFELEWGLVVEGL